MCRCSGSLCEDSGAEPSRDSGTSEEQPDCNNGPRAGSFRPRAGPLLRLYPGHLHDISERPRDGLLRQRLQLAAVVQHRRGGGGVDGGAVVIPAHHVDAGRRRALICACSAASRSLTPSAVPEGMLLQEAGGREQPAGRPLSDCCALRLCERQRSEYSQCQCTDRIGAVLSRDFAATRRLRGACAAGRGRHTPPCITPCSARRPG